MSIFILILLVIPTFALFFLALVPFIVFIVLKHKKNKYEIGTKISTAFVIVTGSLFTLSCLAYFPLLISENQPPSDFVYTTEIILTDDGFKVKGTGEEYILLYSGREESRYSSEEEKRMTSISDEIVFSLKNTEGIDKSRWKNVHKLQFEENKPYLYAIYYSTSNGYRIPPTYRLVDVFCKKTEESEVISYLKETSYLTYGSSSNEEEFETISPIIEKYINSENGTKTTSYFYNDDWERNSYLTFQTRSLLFGINTKLISFEFNENETNIKVTDRLYHLYNASKTYDSYVYKMADDEAALIKNFFGLTANI